MAREGKEGERQRDRETEERETCGRGWCGVDSRALACDGDSERTREEWRNGSQGRGGSNVVPATICPPEGVTAGARAASVQIWRGGAEREDREWQRRPPIPV